MNWPMSGGARKFLNLDTREACEQPAWRFGTKTHRRSGKRRGITGAAREVGALPEYGFIDADIGRAFLVKLLRRGDQTVSGLEEAP